MTSRQSRFRHRMRCILLTAAVLGAVVAALVFEPWKLVVDQRVQEAAPGVTPTLTTAAEPVASRPVVLARGAFISHEHDSTGTVSVLGLPDGSRVLRLEDLRTSNGPLLKVWLSDAAVIDGVDGWRVFDDGHHVDLGDLKGNIGSSNYPIPAAVDLAALPSVSIWCDRFDVSFAAATLHPIA